MPAATAATATSTTHSTTPSTTTDSSKPYLVPINQDDSSPPSSSSTSSSFVTSTHPTSPPPPFSPHTGRSMNDPYVATDNPFSVSLDSSEHLWQEFNISMESVYGIALVGPAVTSRKEFQRKCPANLAVIWAVFNECYILLLLNYIAQFTMIYYMSKFVQKSGGVRTYFNFFFSSFFFFLLLLLLLLFLLFLLIRNK